MFKSLAIKSFSFVRIPVFSFAVVKKPKTPPEDLIKPIWKNIYKRLGIYSDEHIKIEKNLHDSSSDLEPRMKESLRIRLNEIEPTPTPTPTPCIHYMINTRTSSRGWKN